MKYFLTKQSKAQGILEVAIAIYIAVVGILSIINLVVSNLQVERFNHNMLISTNLAREGIEIVRSIRDTNWIKGNAFDHSLTPPVDFIQGVDRTFIIEKYSSNNDYSLTYFDINDDSWDFCVNSEHLLGSGLNPGLTLINPCKLYIKTLDGETTYVNGQIQGSEESFQPTNFYRLIYINLICYNPEDLGEFIMDSPNRNCSPVQTIGIQVISQVGWRQASGMKIIKVQENMYDWR